MMAAFVLGGSYVFLSLLGACLWAEQTLCTETEDFVAHWLFWPIYTARLLWRAFLYAWRG